MLSMNRIAAKYGCEWEDLLAVIAAIVESLQTAATRNDEPKLTAWDYLLSRTCTAHRGRLMLTIAHVRQPAGC